MIPPPLLGRLASLWNSLHNHQSRTLVWGSKFAALLVVFFILYLPVHAQKGSLLRILMQRNNEITAARQSGLNLLEPRELEEASKNVKDFESQLLDVAQASTLISLVSDEAAKHNFTIANINSESAAPVKNEAGKELERNGKKLKRIPVHVQFETNLKNATAFLKSLSESSKRLWVLESLSMQKKSPQSEDLKCDLTLSFFTY